MRTIFPLASQAHCRQTRVSYNLISKLMRGEKISGCNLVQRREILECKEEHSK